jgi:hypothetical protein
MVCVVFSDEKKVFFLASAGESVPTEKDDERRNKQKHRKEKRTKKSNLKSKYIRLYKNNEEDLMQTHLSSPASTTGASGGGSDSNANTPPCLMVPTQFSKVGEMVEEGEGGASSAPSLSFFSQRSFEDGAYGNVEGSRTLPFNFPFATCGREGAEDACVLEMGEIEAPMLSQSVPNFQEIVEMRRRLTESSFNSPLAPSTSLHSFHIDSLGMTHDSLLLCSSPLSASTSSSTPFMFSSESSVGEDARGPAAGGRRAQVEEEGGEDGVFCVGWVRDRGCLYCHGAFFSFSDVNLSFLFQA